MATEARESPATAVATREKRQPTQLEQLITSEQARAYIEPFLPKGVDVQRVAANVMLAVKQDESGLLRRCSPESLIMGVAQIHQWGLELAKDVAYLLPFKNTKKTDAAIKAAKPGEKVAPIYDAVPCADYKALAAMMIATGAVRHVDAREVRDGDVFEYSFGLDSTLVHRPAAGRDRIKRPITAAYVILSLPFGHKVFDVMTAEEIEEVRQQYSKQHKSGPLKRFYAVKTVIRRAAKLLPKDKRFARVLEVIEEETRAEFSGGLDPSKQIVAPVTAAMEDSEERPTAGDVPENCICDHDTGEVDPNCPVHGDFAGEA